MTMLTIENLNVGYVQDVDILQGLSLKAEQGRLTGIIGPNGAGKSTLLKSIFGFLPPHQGSILFREREISSSSPAEIKRMGISYIPQGISTFPQLTVTENLLLGCWTFKGDAKRIKRGLEETFALFPVLADKQKSRATFLSGGEAKMLSIAKELISSPQLILVDEPSAGLSPIITDYVYEFLAQKRDDGLTILLVDQNIQKAAAYSEYLYMFEMGRVKMEGPQAFFAGNIREIIRDSLVGDGEKSDAPG
jgi:ABC-type branched-subunit amino acid transport system ATPase component